MTDNTKKKLREILDNISQMKYIEPEDIPNIDLYMDQVTTFMDEHLAFSKRYEDDKILTKTMINNYAKNNLLPPPVKKKYSKDHILVLIFIYYLKSVLSIKDINTLLEPITDTFFEDNPSFHMSDVYEEELKLQKSRLDTVMKDIIKTYSASTETFSEAEGEDADYMHLFSFICSLSFDVYIKKMLIQKLIDDIEIKQSQKTPSREHKKKKK